MSNIGVAVPISGGCVDEQGAQSRASPADQVRRFMLRWTCDADFREELLVDAQAAVARRGLLLDPGQMRFVWDPAFRAEMEQLPLSEVISRVGPLGLIVLEFQQRNKEFSARVQRECTPADQRFAKWRKRQIARCELIFRSGFANEIPHALFAIELSKGCSVGCWFCGVRAPRLDGHFPYRENADFFRDLLRALRSITGREAGKWSFLYWATDPLDHPDYERFCSDFQGEFGQFPTTTTAQGWKDMARVRRLIQLTKNGGDARFRLSILNMKMLERYLTEFTRDEMAAVNFVPVNKGSLLRPAEAGRAREKRPKDWGNNDAPNAGDTSISCVTGFLVNLVDRWVRLVSPCMSSERWPDGYILFEERQYRDDDDLQSIFEGMVERNMLGSVPPERILRFGEGLSYLRTPDGFHLSIHGKTRQFMGQPPIGEIGDRIALGRYKTSEIVAEMDTLHGAGAFDSLAAINEIFQAGVLDEEPD